MTHARFDGSSAADDFFTASYAVGYTLTPAPRADAFNALLRQDTRNRVLMPRDLLLTGHDLTRRDFYEVVLDNRRVGLAPRARRAMVESRKFVEEIIGGKEAVYGVTTGVGSLSTVRIEPAQARELQLNVVRSHACGVGEPLDPHETRGLLLLAGQYAGYWAFRRAPTRGRSALQLP